MARDTGQWTLEKLIDFEAELLRGSVASEPERREVAGRGTLAQQNG